MSRITNQRAFVNYLVNNMSIEELKSRARESIHNHFEGYSDFEFNEAMLDEGFDPRKDEYHANN